MSKFVVGFVALVLAASLSASGQNKVVCDNQSGAAALVKRSIAGAAQPHTRIGFGDSTSDSDSLRCDSSQSLTGEYLAANDNTKGSSPSFPRTVADRLHGAGSTDAHSSRSSPPSRWTVSAEAIVFDRIGTANRTLVERVPGGVPFADVPTTPGIPALNSTDLDQGFSPGFRLGVTYHTDSSFDWELSFFHLRDWDSTRSIGPDNPPDWLVMRAPGIFFQTQDFTYQSMKWDYSTELYNAELNGRYVLSKRITVLAGFRWVQLNENLQGSIPPPDRILPVWKFNPNNNLFDVARIEILPGIPATGAFPPFWDASTINNLYGLQIGMDGKLFEYGRFSMDGLIKAGGYWNHASASTGVSIQKVVYSTSASTDRPAFVSEAGLQCKYQVASRLALKLGYEVLWLYGVALAPGQIQETYVSAPTVVTSLGIKSDSGVLFHGATAGLDFSF